MKWKLNYPNIPVLSIGFTRSVLPVARIIQLVRGGLTDKAVPNHALIVTEDHGQLFATEQTARGLVENSLEQYTHDYNRIVAMYVWKGFDNPPIREAAQRYLAKIRRKAAEDSKYDFVGLLSFVPGFKKIVKPHPAREWCSETVANLLSAFGCAAIDKTTISPDELLKIVQNKKDEFTAVLGYYI